MESELKKHLRNIKFNADKWEEYVKKIEKIQIEIAGLQAELINLKENASQYSRKTRRLARLEII